MTRKKATCIKVSILRVNAIHLTGLCLASAAASTSAASNVNGVVGYTGHCRSDLLACIRPLIAISLLKPSGHDSAGSLLVLRQSPIPIQLLRLPFISFFSLVCAPHRIHSSFFFLLM
jgi:hypothetical protein